MLQATGLTYDYPGGAELQFPDLTVQGGSALLICGESGCGKTTLLHLIAGLLKPLNGQISLDNDQISGFTPSKMDQFRGRHIGIVHQKPHFIHSISILDNLMLSPHVKDKEKVRAVANRLQISDEQLSRRPHKLSSGQQQRVTIARAVMNEPKLLLADEPTSALDNKNCNKVIDLLLEEASVNDAALIIATHDERLRNVVSNSLDLPPIKS